MKAIFSPFEEDGRNKGTFGEGVVVVGRPKN